MPLPLSLASVKSRLVLPFLYRPTRVVPDKGPLYGCVIDWWRWRCWYRPSVRGCRPAWRWRRGWWSCRQVQASRAEGPARRGTSGSTDARCRRRRWDAPLRPPSSLRRGWRARGCAPAVDGRARPTRAPALHQPPTHTHPFNGPLPVTTRVSRYQKGKTNLDFTEARDSEWQWHQLGHMQVCISLQTDKHASTPPLSFYGPDALPAAQPTASKYWRPKPPTYMYAKKVAYTRLPSVGFRSLSWFLAVSLQVTWVINPAVGCHYFPPQPLRGLLPVLLLGEQRQDGCEQFA